jgi:hypothetical protein
MNRIIRFNLTADDYVEANRLHTMRASRGALWAMIAIVWLIYSGLPFFINGKWDWPHAAASAGVGAIMAAIVVILVYRYTLARRSRRIFAQQKSLHSEVEASWDNDGLELATPSARSRHHWTDFQKWTEGPNVILLYQSDVLFNMLPKRVFSSDADGDSGNPAQGRGPAAGGPALTSDAGGWGEASLSTE